jgi:hypothetical protein
MLLMTQLGRGIAGMYDPTSLTGYSSSSLGQGIGGALEGIMALRKQAQEFELRKEDKQREEEWRRGRASVERAKMMQAEAERKTKEGEEKTRMGAASESAGRVVKDPYEGERILTRAAAEEFKTEEPVSLQFRGYEQDKEGNTYRVMFNPKTGAVAKQPLGEGETPYTPPLSPFATTSDKPIRTGPRTREGGVDPDKLTVIPGEEPKGELTELESAILTSLKGRVEKYYAAKVQLVMENQGLDVTGELAQLKALYGLSILEEKFGFNADDPSTWEAAVKSMVGEEDPLTGLMGDIPYE